MVPGGRPVFRDRLGINLLMAVHLNLISSSRIYRFQLNYDSEIFSMFKTSQLNTAL